MSQILQPQHSLLQENVQNQTISIVMPVYNLENDIHKISNISNLVRKRLGENFELVVVDDGSTDHTYSVAKRIEDERLKVVGYQPFSLIFDRTLIKRQCEIWMGDGGDWAPAPAIAASSRSSP